MKAYSFIKIALLPIIVTIIVLLQTSLCNAESFAKYSDEYQQYLLSKEFTLRHDTTTHILNTNQFEHWIRKYPKYFYKGFEVKPPDDIDLISSEMVNAEFDLKEVWGIDRAEIKNYIENTLFPVFEKTRSDVTISKDENGNIIFEGVGFDGKKIDIERMISLIKFGMENDGIEHIQVPLSIEKAVITLNDPDLDSYGLKEIIAVGESEFHGSTWSRIHNIKTGSSKLSGKLIEPEEIYSIGDNLGPVNGLTGYKQELVIKGSKTIPEYGGGLCQVSSTLYRGALRAGVPIVERTNHSYAVSYYKPYGTDATIYPPTVDLKFQNDTGKHILLQSHVDVDNRKLYFIYYGTSDGRKTELFGPYLSNWRGAPAAKVEYSTSLAPGEKKFFGHAVAGVDSTWYRYVTSGTGSEMITETIFSHYQARPTYYAIGQEAEAVPPPSI